MDAPPSRGEVEAVDLDGLELNLKEREWRPLRQGTRSGLARGLWKTDGEMLTVPIRLRGVNQTVIARVPCRLLEEHRGPPTGRAVG
jgi:hypothetical protein